MNRENYKIINFILFISITLLFGIGAIMYTPVLFVYYSGVIATILIIKNNNKDRKQFIDTLLIFLSTLFFGFLLAFAVNADFINEGTTFRYPDQMHFFESSEILGHQSSIREIINYTYSNFSQYHIVYILFGILSYLDVQVGGSVNFLPLLVHVAYVTALIPVFLYHILKLFVPRKTALYGVLYYGILTSIMSYSGYFLRDNHISLLTIIALFWMVRNVTLKRILLISLLIPIVASMRLSNSLLILAMLSIFIFSGNTSKILRFSFISIGIVLLIIFSGRLIDVISSTGDRLDNYVEFTSNIVSEKGGASLWLHSLPPIIKETGIFVSALFPFPFGGGYQNATTLSQYVMVTYDTITEIGWYIIFVGLIFFAKSIYIKVKHMPNKILLALVLLFILYMYANTTNMVIRRVTCVIPFIYIPFLIVYNEASNTTKYRYKRIALGSALFLVVLSVFIYI